MIRAVRGGGTAAGFALLLSGCAGGVHRMVDDAPVRVGRPYTVAGRSFVPRDEPGYDTIGEASWYGTREQGKRTAGGERFDRRRVSAAHPTLPMPSYVEVTRLDTGAREIVRINDRGPFARGRILDLSREAARAIDVDRAGHALVRVRRVTPTAKQAKALRRGYPVVLASVAPSASPLGVGPRPALPPRLPVMPAVPIQRMPPGPTIREIVVATPADPDAADALASALAGEGGRAVATGGGYRVVTGPYADEDMRQAALARLRARGYGGAVALDASPDPQPNGTAYP